MPARNYKERDLNSSISHIFLITPSDTVDLAEFATALRIWNPGGSAATIVIETVDGDTVTLTVPATSLTVEPVYTARVRVTGTTAGLIIHGYM
jgi:hypothetical protein